MVNVSLPDLINADFRWIGIFAGIMLVMYVSVAILKAIERNVSAGPSPMIEKPKRSLESLADEKPKRLIGDDGELFHPIEEFFYTEESEDGQA